MLHQKVERWQVLNAILIVAAIELAACQPFLESPESTPRMDISVQVSQPDQSSSGGSAFSETSAPPDALTPQPTAERATAEQYSTTDRPDDNDGYQIHLVYALPSDGKDDQLDLRGDIALSAEAMDRWLEGKIEHRLRFDTYEGKIDISYLQVDATADQISDLGTDILSLMDHEIKSRGFSSDHKLYVVYYDGFFVTPEGYCGLATYPPDGAGLTAVLLLRGYNPNLDLTCPRSFTKSEDYTGYFEMTILHELLHLIGMVPECAANFADGHVDDSSQDLMFYQYDGSYSPLYTYLDLHYDDYYDHGIPNCPDLARSVFLDPLPKDAELPPGWQTSSTYLPPNPLIQSEK